MSLPPPGLTALQGWVMILLSRAISLVPKDDRQMTGAQQMVTVVHAGREFSVRHSSLTLPGASQGLLTMPQ